MGGKLFQGVQALGKSGLCSRQLAGDCYKAFFSRILAIISTFGLQIALLELLICYGSSHHLMPQPGFEPMSEELHRPGTFLMDALAAKLSCHESDTQVDLEIPISSLSLCHKVRRRNNYLCVLAEGQWCNR